MKVRLFTPGPTPVPERVRLSQAKQIIHHRTPEFSTIFKKVCEDLKYVFQTENDVLIFASSGTGAMEACITNLLSPGDRILVTNGGKFGERWANIGEAFGLEVKRIDVTPGTAPEPDKIKKILKEDKDIKAVFTQLVETSTGVRYNIKEIGEVVSTTDAVLVVDAISGLGAEPLFTDRWSIDVVVAGSQKALMLPPGLSFVSLSEKALKLAERATLPRFYWDFKKAKSALSKGQTPFTPAVSLICALEEALNLIKQEGLETIFKRHFIFAEAVRRAVLAMGLKIFGTPPSNALTAIVVPSEIEERKLRKMMQEEFGTIVAGGQEELSGKIIRIAHLGWMDTLDIIGVVCALELCLYRLGYKVELGTAAKAAQQVFAENL